MVWRWLKQTFSAPAPVAREPEAPAEEAILLNLLERVAEPSEEGRLAIGDREFWVAVRGLIALGRERVALDILGRIVSADPQRHEVAMRLAELLCERLEHAQARPLLERLAAVPEFATRARLLLSDIAERLGDPREARRQVEYVLALDIDYPQAKSRAARLGEVTHAPPLAAESPTLAGISKAGAELDRWRLLRELGRGAAGAVYVAHDRELDREVALKILHPHARSRALPSARAWIEARLAAAIRHPGVIAIYDLDEARQLIAMELCAGGSLAATLRRGPLPLDAALGRASELLSTLAYVHQRGVVHGDLKPGNLLWRELPEQSELVLADFGVAQLSEGASEQPGGIGTLAYMAPEQRYAPASCASDAFSAGVVLLELFVGSATLQTWRGDRAALLQGERGWPGQLPASVEAALGPRRAAALVALLLALLDARPEERPSLDAARRAVADLS